MKSSFDEMFKFRREWISYMPSFTTVMGNPSIQASHVLLRLIM
ncbi:hypothetical protein RK21_02070 [Pseudomonas plecoglossicida]|nr:hypothetical protein RK21_02070 [Pseudomonas plecoglossicida]